MSSRTRYFLIGSALIVVVGLCTGLVAYYNGALMPSGAAARLPEIVYIPSDATAIAYADVKDIMSSDFRRQLRANLAADGDASAGKDRFLAETGIDVERDIDSVVAGVRQDATGHREPVVLLRGRFDVAKIEGLATQKGAIAEEYNGRRLLVAPHGGTSETQPSMAFLEPNLLALGTRDGLRAAIDAASGPGVTANTELMSFVADAQRRGNAWVVGRFDALSQQPGLPDQIRQQLPPVDWFVITADVDRAVHGVIRAEARDEQSGERLRGMVNTALGAAQMLAGRDARLDATLKGVQATGSGKTLQVTFDVGPEMLDLVKHGPMGLSMPAPTPAPAPAQ
ncbi:MAG TPA: hypothetical protein VHB78_09320 [Vicinamibacterales bacterium]|jgi:hypothetical protein|nr:hypothetical protein [Vicinamibacterales bacterium]